MFRHSLLAGVVIALAGLGAATAHAAQTVVTLGFDDGLATQYDNRALLSSRGLHGTFYVNTAKLGQPAEMTWDQVAAMAADGNEIGGHTLHHVNLAGKPADQQRTEICDDRAALVAHGYAPTSFAYPNGVDDASARAIVQDCGYRTARTTWGIDWPTCDVCAETFPPRNVFETRALEAHFGVTPDDLEVAVRNAQDAGGGWLQLVFHDICDGCDDYGIPASVFGPFFDWLVAEQNAGRLIVRTAAQALDPSLPPPDTTPPTVALTAPADGAALTGPTTLTADADDASGIARVEFLVNGTVVATDASAPYAATWDPASTTDASVAISARAVDSAGNATTSTARTVTITRQPPPDTTPPAVALTSPTQGATVGGTTTLAATATDDVGVTRVDFLVNGTVVATDTSAPYSGSWNTATTSGTTATVTARASDAAGNTTTSAARTVRITRPDTTAPAVALTAPANNALVGATATLSATASDNVGVARVEFLVNGTVIASDASAPYSVTWNTTTTTGATATITARAVDAAGNATTSAARTVRLPQRDTTPPTVAITAPANNAQVRSPITITATASDDVGVTAVRFYVDGTVRVTDTTAPYSATGALTAGTRTLIAEAVDAAGNTTRSTPITVRITR